MSGPTPSDPLHGVTLERLLTELVEHYGWDELAQRVKVRCFTSNPSVKSSLTFLRKTPWAREKVEGHLCALETDRRVAGRGGGTVRLALPVAYRQSPVPPISRKASWPSIRSSVAWTTGILSSSSKAIS